MDDMNEMKQKNAIAIRYNDSNKVVIANELIRSRQDDLSLLETKLIRLLISQIAKKDISLQTYSCNINDLAAFLGIRPQNIYRDIKHISESLMGKRIFVGNQQDGDKASYEIFHWVDYVKYADGILTIELSSKLRPYVLGLDKLFTLYGYDVVVALPTSNAIRLYELLSSYKSMVIPGKNYPNKTDILLEEDEILFDINWLRDYFNCTDKYENSNRFITQVIDKSMSYINNQTFMSVSYRIVRNRRTISHLVFRVADNSTPWMQCTSDFWKSKFGTEFPGMPE